MPARRHWRQSSFAIQADALIRKNAVMQQRRWAMNACLVATPLLFSTVLAGLQGLVNRQLDSPAFRCGCRCTACCDWFNQTDGIYQWECYSATAERPCSPYSTCKAHDSSQCGVMYSKDQQVAYCAVEDPPVWPALLQVPKAQDRLPKTAPQDGNGSVAGAAVPDIPAPLLYTGLNQTLAAELMRHLLGRDVPLSTAVQQSQAPPAGGVTAIATSAAGTGAALGNISSSTTNDTQFVAAVDALSQGLTSFQLIMGSSKPATVTLLVESGFFPQSASSSAAYSADANSPAPLFFPLSNCSAQAPLNQLILERLGGVLQNSTGVPVQCASLPAVWRSSAAEIQEEIYCGGRRSGCFVQDGTRYALDSNATSVDDTYQQFASAQYDWRNTDASGLRLNMWLNASFVTGSSGQQGPPPVQRWSQAMNLAANAFLRTFQGPGYSARLAGVSDMPTAASRLVLDFSSLLGPLFFMWLLQLLLPVNVYALVHEKEAGLRLMMKLQGLSDTAYTVVMYGWHLALYCAYTAVFMAFGSLIGLQLFTRNSLSLQVVFYWLWGNMLCAWSIWVAAMWTAARPAVLICIVWVIGSGLVANLVLVQLLEQGVRGVLLAELVPSFSLFRGLYELSQYAFLASRNGGEGLTWAKLRDPGCGMLVVWLIWALQWAGMLMQAWWIEQVAGTGVSARKHPLFLFGFKFHDPVSAPPAKPESSALSSLKDQSNRAGATAGIEMVKLGSGAGPAHGQARSGFRVIGGIPAKAPVQLMEPNADADSHSLGYYGRSSGLFGAPPTPRTPQASGLDEIEALPTPPGWADQPHGPAGDPTCASPGGSQRAGAEVEEDPQTMRQAAEPADVAAERARVEALWEQRLWPGGMEGVKEAILLRNLRKVYGGKDGNPDTVAVVGLSLAIGQGEVFGLLGPNGAGKSTTISLLEGFLEPTSGAALIGGHDVRNEMEAIYPLMGTCPQHDLLWPPLSARQHLLFYARLKRLQGGDLKAAVQASLRSVNLLADGLGDKPVSSYSGGMKRRLSVAISLIGNPQVVYLDEPSTGLDPSSRRLLWAVIRREKAGRAVVLTTHSMAEAEELCDRLGIFVGGRLYCLGNPKDLTARFGSYITLSLTTPPQQEQAAAALVYQLTPNARRVYTLGGTQRWELPVSEVSVSSAFAAVDAAKREGGGLTVLDWGISNASLEDVFMQITSTAGVSM